MCTARYFSTFVGNGRLFPTPFLSLLTLLIISISTLPVAIGDTKLKATDFEATKTFAGVIQVEAEILELTTYLVEDSPFSSGGKVISLRGAAGNNGIGSGQFRGSEGDYIIVVNYMDENDGISHLRVEANGATVDSWALDQELGFPGPNASILTARSLGAVHLSRGDTYSIHGDKNNNEETRVDFIQFIPIPAKDIPGTNLYQAEDATFSPLFNIKTEKPGFTGTGYVDAFRDGSITWTGVKAEGSTTGDYSLDFRYAYGSDDPQTTRPLNIYVNEVLAVSKTPFKTTGVYSRWQNQTAVVQLNAGSDNTIRIETPGTPGAGIDNLMANIDYLSVTPANYLSKFGPVSPEPSAYSPEVGDIGYEESYYGKVDPMGKRRTLPDWKHVNGFNDPTNQVTSAEYINAFDLGFGRIMSCLDNEKASCYVENFLDPGTVDERFAATVTMERITKDDGNSYVAFFVYDADDKRINQIPLDSEGPKSVPESCYACHGGQNDPMTGEPSGGHYLPWDKELLKEWKDHATLTSQEGAFRGLNQIALDDADRTSDGKRIKSLIQSWYGGADPDSGNAFDDSPFDQGQNRIPKDKSKKDWLFNTDFQALVDAFSAAGSNTERDRVQEQINQYFSESYLYTGIYAKYCRSCHVAQNAATDWNKATDFKAKAYNQICKGSNSPFMPHAELTDDRFSNIVVQFVHGEPETALQTLCSTPPAVVTQQQIDAGETKFNSDCTLCHSIVDPATAPGGNISCSNKVTENLGAIDAQMNALSPITSEEVVNLTAYLNADGVCIP